MQAFDDQLALQSPFAAQMGGWGRTDVIEADDGSEYTVRVEVPGCHKENTKVTIKENVMRVRADREDESDDSGDGFTTYSSFVAHLDRSWTLPEDFDKDSGIKPKIDHGVLSIKVPRITKKAAGAAGDEGEAEVPWHE